MGAKPQTPAEYLAALPEDRRELVERIRETILGSLPEGFEEQITFGMLGYVVPLEVFPDTYNGEPLGTVALANQKNHVSVYLMGAYADPAAREQFVEAWKASGRRLDMGKSCVRLRSLDGVAFDVLADAVAAVTPSDLIAAHEAAHHRS